MSLAQITSRMSKGVKESPEFTNFMDRIKAVPEKIKETPPKKFGKYGAGLVLGGIGFGWVAFPYILAFAISQIVTLQEGSDIRAIWKNLPQALDFHVYLFNITNPKEVQNGGVPVLKEVGPYKYKEYKAKVDLVDDEEEDTVTYNNLNTWYFQEKETLPLTGHELITIPNVALWSMLLLGENDFPPSMMTIINSGIPKIFGKLTDVFMTTKAKDLMFDGIQIDCRAKDLIGRTICVALKENSRSLIKLPNNRYLFSFFGSKNATPEDVRITVKRGVKNQRQIGTVVKINGKSENTVWKGDECNKLVGTDSTIFPPYPGPDNKSILAYSPEMCRSLNGEYEGEGEYQGIKGHKYTINLGDMSVNPKESCYCPKSRCLKKGTTDLTKCQGAPIIVSLPHFYLADESYLKGVIGLRPEKDIHETTFIMEHVSGTPLSARKRVQFNVHIHPVRYVNLTKKLKPTLMPLFWVEEGLDLEELLMNFLEANLFTNIRLVDGLKWTMIVAGSLVCFGGMYQYRRKKEEGKRVTPGPSPSNSSREQLIHSTSPYILEPSRLSSVKTSADILYPPEHPNIPSPPVEVFTLSERLYQQLSPHLPPVETSQPSRLSTVKEDPFSKPPSDDSTTTKSAGLPITAAIHSPKGRGTSS